MMRWTAIDIERGGASKTMMDMDGIGGARGVMKRRDVIEERMRGTAADIGTRAETMTLRTKNMNDRGIPTGTGGGSGMTRSLSQRVVNLEKEDLIKAIEDENHGLDHVRQENLAMIHQDESTVVMIHLQHRSMTSLYSQQTGLTLILSKL